LFRQFLKGVTAMKKFSTAIKYALVGFTLFNTAMVFAAAESECVIQPDGSCLKVDVTGDKEPGGGLSGGSLGGGGGGGGEMGGGGGSGASAEAARKERCAANKRLLDAFSCNSRPTVKPTFTSDLGISNSNQRTDLWGPAALGLATRSFDGALNLNDFQRGLREGLDYCKQDQPCISEVLIYFGVNTFPTFNFVTDFLNWAYTYLASQTFGPNVYGDSAAGRMASRWELGAACNTLRQANNADSCAP
jgi:hypothetical protein